MNKKKLFNYLSQLDKLHQLNWRGKPIYIHNDHRFATLLPFLQDEVINYRLIMFDGHHDGADISPQAKEVAKTLNTGSSLEKVLDFVKNKLACNDGDWVKGSMELGILNDAVVFGVRRDLGMQSGTIYTDHNGTTHKLLFDSSFPSEMFGHQGALADLVDKPQDLELRALLNWEYNREKGFDFTKQNSKIWVNLDLDAFIIPFDEFIFPWPEEVFKKRFQEVSSFSTTQDWSGERFFEELLTRADLISISREPTYCGGEAKCNQIFKSVNQYLFQGDLKK